MFVTSVSSPVDNTKLNSSDCPQNGVPQMQDVDFIYYIPLRNISSHQLGTKPEHVSSEGIAL